MTKLVKWGLATLVGFVVVLQLFQPTGNWGEREVPEDLFAVVPANDSVKNILVNSCYDCHSNYTNSPWYSYVAPLSFFINRHVREAKEKLNFSEWANFSSKDQLSYLVDICEELEDDEMPLKSYLIMHKNARLDKNEKKRICDWAETLGMHIMTGGQ